MRFPGLIGRIGYFRGTEDDTNTRLENMAQMVVNTAEGIGYNTGIVGRRYCSFARTFTVRMEHSPR